MWIFRICHSKWRLLNSIRTSHPLCHRETFSVLQYPYVTWIKLLDRGENSKFAHCHGYRVDNKVFLKLQHAFRQKLPSFKVSSMHCRSHRIRTEEAMHSRCQETLCSILRTKRLLVKQMLLQCRRVALLEEDVGFCFAPRSRSQLRVKINRSMFDLIDERRALILRGDATRGALHRNWVITVCGCSCLTDALPFKHFRTEASLWQRRAAIWKSFVWVFSPGGRSSRKCPW